MEKVDYLFKVVLIGDAGAGKTSILDRYHNGSFRAACKPTVGSDFIIKTMQIDGKTVKLHIWDTSGCERFQAITRSFYHAAHAALIVYDITSQSTFKNAQNWIKEVRRYGEVDVQLIIIGNKCDLEDERMVDLKEAVQMYQDTPGFLFAMESSAKENINVDDSFFRLATELKHRHTSRDLTMSDSIRLSDSKPLPLYSYWNWCSS